MKLDAVTVELPNQVKLQYVERGDSSGLPLILLHGYADSWRSFERVLFHLPRSIRALALTQRGHGDSSRPATGYHPRDFVADLAGFMDTLDLETAVVAGGSSGGIIARHFAIDHAHRTSGLVLIGAPLTLQDKPAAINLWHSTISKLKDPIDPGFVRDFLKSQLAQKVPKSFLDTMVKENLKVPARVWRETLEGLLENGPSEEISRIKTPTLLVWGDKDVIIPRSEQEALRGLIAGSRLVVYHGAGHALYWEEPGRVASDIAAFIAGLNC